MACIVPEKKSKICSMSWQAGDSGETMTQFQSKGQHPGDPRELIVQMMFKVSLLENSLLLRDASLLILFRPLTDWMRPTDIIEGNLHYSEFTNLNTNLIQKYHPI